MLNLLTSGLAGPTTRRDSEKLVPLSVGIDEVEEHESLDTQTPTQPR